MQKGNHNDSEGRGNEKYLDLFKENILLKQEKEENTKTIEKLSDENNKLHWKIQKQKEDASDATEKRDIKWFGGSVTALLVAAFISFCVGSCCNGCAEYHHMNGPEVRGYSPTIVQSIEQPGNGHEYVYYYLGNNIILKDKRGMFNVGDTIKFIKK